MIGTVDVARVVSIRQVDNDIVYVVAGPVFKMVVFGTFTAVDVVVAVAADVVAMMLLLLLMVLLLLLMALVRFLRLFAEISSEFLE